MYKYLATEHYFSRDLSWIEFNRRVLSEGMNRSLHPLERLKFLAIVSSNFDEFFMVRVASLRQERKHDDRAGFRSSRQLSIIYEEYRSITTTQLEIFHNEIMPALESEGIVYNNLRQLSAKEKNYLRGLFMQEYFPILTPLHLSGKGLQSGNAHLQIAFLLRNVHRSRPRTQAEHAQSAEQAENGANETLSVVQLPVGVQRIIKIPISDNSSGASFTLLDDLIICFAQEIFPGCDIADHLLFHITRDADAPVDESRQDDFIEAMEEVLFERLGSEITRFNACASESRMREKIQGHCSINETEVCIFPHPVDLGGFMELAQVVGYELPTKSRQKPLEPYSPDECGTIWDWLKERDRLVLLPFESFSPVIRLLNEAADDPNVLAVKITLYRTSRNSPIIAALERAARRGKQVTVVLELKARFDEERNIQWAESLEDAGAIVIYGIESLKIHAKAMLIVRKEERGIRRYLHMSTGNYNEKTAGLYTDIGFFTSDETLCYETSLFFNAITGYSDIPVLKELIIAPISLRQKLLHLIQREIDKHSEENPSVIRAKINSLSDIRIINALYRASQAGVRIELNVRGICMLRPGLAGLSENIRVVSILGNYLEHSRLISFHNASNTEIYISSADWMERNLDRRVEILLPIREQKLVQVLSSLLNIYFDSPGYYLEPDGSYTFKNPAGNKPARSTANRPSGGGGIDSENKPSGNDKSGDFASGFGDVHSANYESAQSKIYAFAQRRQDTGSQDSLRMFNVRRAKK